MPERNTRDGNRRGRFDMELFQKKLIATRKEVTYRTVVERLKAKGVAHKVKIVNRGELRRAESYLGPMRESYPDAVEFTVMVSGPDYEKAWDAILNPAPEGGDS